MHGPKVRRYGVRDGCSLIHHSDEHVPIPDTGSLRGDLHALASSVAANIGSAGGARRSRSIGAERACARGEISPDSDRRLIVEAVVAPIWFRLLLTGGEIDDDLVDSVVDLVTVGVRQR